MTRNLINKNSCPLCFKLDKSGPWELVLDNSITSSSSNGRLIPLKRNGRRQAKEPFHSCAYACDVEVIKNMTALRGLGSIVIRLLNCIHSVLSISTMVSACADLIEKYEKEQGVSE
jgi:hypothetical protein